MAVFPARYLYTPPHYSHPAQREREQSQFASNFYTLLCYHRVNAATNWGQLWRGASVLDSHQLRDCVGVITWR